MTVQSEIVPPPADAAEEINRLHAGIEQTLRRGVSDAIKIGQLLSEQKVRLDHGQWLPWCQKNLKFSLKTADRYRSLYQHRHKFVTVTNLTEAYTALLAPKVPPALSEVPKEKPAEQVETREHSQPAAEETREEFLSRMGVRDIPKLEDEPQKDSETVWSLKFNWKKARKAEKAAFLSWIRERGELTSGPVQKVDAPKVGPEPQPELIPASTDQSKESKKATRTAVAELDHAMGLWLIAKARLDQIDKSDVSRVKVLELVRDYALNRLRRNQ